MISFRFHVVSITAIFLAIAIGVVVGSTYVDGAVVDRLRNRIRHRRGQRRPTPRGERPARGRARDDAASTSTLSAEYAVTDRLTDVPVLSSRPAGVDEAAVERTVVLARRAGGRVPGIVWLEPRWASEGEEDLEALAAIVGGSAPSDPRGPLGHGVGGHRRRAGRRPGGPGRIADGDGPATLDAGRPRGGRVPHRRLARRRRPSASPTCSAPARGCSSSPAPAPRRRSRRSSRSRWTRASTPGSSRSSADVYVVAPEAPGAGRAAHRVARRGAARGRSCIVDDADLEAGRVAAVLALDCRGRRRGRPALRLRRRGRRRAARLDPAVTTAPEGAVTSLSRSAAGMGAAAAVSRAFGGVRMVVIAAVLGTTFLGNAFQASNSVSNVLFELLAAGALSAVLVPTFVERFGRGEQRRAEEVAGGLLSLAWVGLGVVTVVGIVGRAVARRPPHHRRRRSRRSPPSSRSSPPTCCGSSSRRCCSTRSARSPPPCSTPRAGSR